MALPKETLLEMYRVMVLSPRLDERAWVLHRQGKIAFHISGIGHEAAQIGAAFALQRGQDWVVPYYRDLAMLLALGLSPREFALGLMGKKGEPSSGARQMPSHWSLRRANVVSHSSPVATQTPHASGIALGIKMRGDSAVVLTSIGEGSTSQGEGEGGGAPRRRADHRRAARPSADPALVGRRRPIVPPAGRGRGDESRRPAGGLPTAVAREEDPHAQGAGRGRSRSGRGGRRRHPLCRGGAVSGRVGGRPSGLP